MVGNTQTADLLLVAADGRKLAAHRCILRQRAPGFFQRHIEPTIVATPREILASDQVLEVAIGDIDSVGLEFFIRSVYTEEEIASIPDSGRESLSQRDDDDRVKRTKSVQRPKNFYLHGAGSRSSQHTFQMDDSGEFDGADDETPQGDGDSLENSMTVSSEMAQMAPNPIASEPEFKDPIMTSFRDLASASPACMSSSLHSERSRCEPDIIEEDESQLETSSDDRMIAGFIHLDESGTSQSEESAETPRRDSKPIFSMFVGLNGESEMTQSLPAAPDGIRGRAILARRLSVTSLTSLTSIDLTPNHDGNVPSGDRNPSCKLAADLMEMYLNKVDTDVVIKTQNGDVQAHKCILSATCPYFKKHLEKSRRIEMKGYSRVVVHFFVSFLYGGLTCVPEEVDIWEVISLATHLNVPELGEVALLHLRTNKCHFFHRPCATCVSAVFDSLSQFHSIKCLRPLYDETMLWQAKYFSRVWKGRVFLNLHERWQQECLDTLMRNINEENVIDTILGCEKLQISLPRSKSQSAADQVQAMVSEVVDFSTEFLVQQFDAVVASSAFSDCGKGLALNLALLEDVFPSLVHSLSADTAIRTFKTLGELMVKVQKQQQSPRRVNSLSIPVDEWSPRFYNLVRRLYELTDKHLLHYAGSVVKAEAWNLLSEQEQSRINETGIFVEMRQARAPPPKLSSLNRTYKRSSSVGMQIPSSSTMERARSLERTRHFGVFCQVEEAPEALEELHREKTQDSIHRRANSLKETKSKEARPAPPSAPPEAPAAPSPAEIRRSRTQSKTPPASAKNSPKRGPPPVKKHLSPTKASEESKLERENTHTIMTVQQNRAAGITHSTTEAPHATPLVKAKPQSVVKPMPKSTPLAATNATVSIPGSRAGSAKSATGRSTPSQTASKRQSALPNRTAAAQAYQTAKSSLSVDKTKRRQRKSPEAEGRGPSRIPRSPKTARKNV
ncbi:hypothetical protein QR680_018079 [Steinernema hermaphroditum]|uniref:BTB domain-containing protein n=1 Tax=Steinernema hermaphroditum TaxID=289476 RepID=A0AA39HHK9_9BILA|nr:hypothetical protein QR680_018079 [Steinernema hermaphroditum]